MKELENSVDVLDQEESIGLKGGDNNGASAYYLIYGTQLPEGTGYDVATNTCYSLSSLPGPYNYQNPVPSGCPACQQYDYYNNNIPSDDGTGQWSTPAWEWLFKTLPHEMGWGSHTGGSK